MEGSIELIQTEKAYPFHAKVNGTVEKFHGMFNQDLFGAYTGMIDRTTVIFGKSGIDDRLVAVAFSLSRTIDWALSKYCMNSHIPLSRIVTNASAFLSCLSFHQQIQVYPRQNQYETFARISYTQLPLMIISQFSLWFLCLGILQRSRGKSVIEINIQLYTKYSLSDNEISFMESMIKLM